MGYQLGTYFPLSMSFSLFLWNKSDTFRACEKIIGHV